MPKQPVVSGAEVVRAFERLGFEQVRQRGSHVVMRKANQGCTIPMHREIRRGTLATIIRQSGVTVDEFLAALAQ